MHLNIINSHFPAPFSTSEFVVKVEVCVILYIL